MQKTSIQLTGSGPGKAVKSNEKSVAVAPTKEGDEMKVQCQLCKPTERFFTGIANLTKHVLEEHGAGASAKQTSSTNSKVSSVVSKKGVSAASPNTNAQQLTSLARTTVIELIRKQELCGYDFQEQSASRKERTCLLCKPRERQILGVIDFRVHVMNAHKKKPSAVFKCFKCETSTSMADAMVRHLKLTHKLGVNMGVVADLLKQTDLKGLAELSGKDKESDLVKITTKAELMEALRETQFSEKYDVTSLEGLVDQSKKAEAAAETAPSASSDDVIIVDVKQEKEEQVRATRVTLREEDVKRLLAESSDYDHTKRRRRKSDDQSLQACPRCCNDDDIVSLLTFDDLCTHLQTAHGVNMTSLRSYRCYMCSSDKTESEDLIKHLLDDYNVEISRELVEKYLLVTDFAKLEGGKENKTDPPSAIMAEAEVEQVQLNESTMQDNTGSAKKRAAEASDADANPTKVARNDSASAASGDCGLTSASEEVGGEEVEVGGGASNRKESSDTEDEGEFDIASTFATTSTSNPKHTCCCSGW